MLSIRKVMMNELGMVSLIMVVECSLSVVIIMIIISIIVIVIDDCSWFSCLLIIFDILEVSVILMVVG